MEWFLSSVQGSLSCDQHEVWTVFHIWISKCLRSLFHQCKVLNHFTVGSISLYSCICNCLFRTVYVAACYEHAYPVVWQQQSFWWVAMNSSPYMHILTYLEVCPQLFTHSWTLISENTWSRNVTFGCTSIYFNKYRFSLISQNGVHNKHVVMFQLGCAFVH